VITIFERFTERARQVVVLSQEEARNFKHNYIGTEHILLGLIREEEGLAARVLEAFDVTIERTRAQLIRIAGSGEVVTEGQIPFTPRSKMTLEVALREALSLGHNYIGTEHILLALCREPEGVGSRILNDFLGENWDKDIRNEIVRMLSGSKGPGTTVSGQGYIKRIYPRELTRNLLTPSTLGKLKVQHRRLPDFKGTLTDYDWHNDRCTVYYIESIGNGGMQGVSYVHRTELNVVDSLQFDISAKEENKE
jgi:ATP-dependent Clp protease ATP-binding subunit ClpA